MTEPISQLRFINDQLNNVSISDSGIDLIITRELMLRDQGVIAGYKNTAQISSSNYDVNNLSWHLKSNVSSYGYGQDEIIIPLAQKNQQEYILDCYETIDLSCNDINKIDTGDSTATQFLIINSLRRYLYEQLSKQLKDTTISIGSKHRDTSTHDSKYRNCIRVESKDIPLIHIYATKTFASSSRFYSIEIIINQFGDDPILHRLRLDVQQQKYDNLTHKLVKIIMKYVKKAS